MKTIFRSIITSAIVCGLAPSCLAAEAESTAVGSAAIQSWAPTLTKAHALAYSNALDTGVMSIDATVHVVVALKLRNKAALDEFTKRLASPKAPLPLTTAEFMDRHAPTRGQAVQVVNYLRSHGFQNVSMSDNRLLVTADANPLQIKQAFRAELHHFNVGGRQAYANVTDVQIPSTLSGSVLAVAGLQTVNRAHTMLKYVAPASLSAQTLSPLSVVAVSPTQFAGIYGASGMPSASSATIGIITAGSMTQTLVDLKNFASKAGYPAPPVSVVTVGTPGTDTSGLDEWNMDSQAALAAAGGTIHSMLLYTATSLDESDITAAFNKAVSDNYAKVINVSLGECESSAQSSGFQAAGDQIFQAAVAQGQTFSISSGDSGAYECGGTTSQQSYPAVSPYVMAIGGTTLSSSGGNWVSETAWSCQNASDCSPNASGGTGGGVSSTEAAPAWQTAASVLKTPGKRGVPDISFDADPNSGALILINGSNVQIGGTSLAAPLFAGFYSRIQAAHGNSLGFPATTLYAGAATSPSWFHDVTSGSNGGYTTGVGWDYVTGYGSVQIQNFSSAFAGGSALNVAFNCTTSKLSVQCTDSSTDSGGTIASRAWTFGDGGTSTATNPSHTYASAGTYTILETVTETGTGKQASQNQTVVLATDPVPTPQLLLNTGFESGAQSWSATPGVVCTVVSCDGEAPRAGNGFAWLDGYGTSNTDTLAQTVAIPAGKTSAVLSFYLHVDTDETVKRPNDTLAVQVLDAKGTLLETLATYSNLNAAAGYSLKSLNLKAYIGKTVKINFKGVENGSLQTSFILDDVTLTVQ